MALRQFVTISGERFDITGLEITPETSCDRCGRYTNAKTTVQVNAAILGEGANNVTIELCTLCVGTYHPGLADVANKVAGRA